MIDPEEEFDYENDESWYEDAMNALDGPSHNHDTVYSEEEIADLNDTDKTIIRRRNSLLQNGFEYTELKNGDYAQEVIGRSNVIHAALCSFVLAYKKEKNYIVIYQLMNDDESVVMPVHQAALIYVNKHLGSYQFLEFFHLEEELQEDQKDLNAITINRELLYKEKPSLEFYRSDNLSINKKYVERMEKLNPHLFEFLNEYVIVDLGAEAPTESYLGLMDEWEE